MQKLQDHGGSGLVTIPKGLLEIDGVLEDGDIPDEQCVDVDRLGERTYMVRLTSGAGDLPDLQECDVVERLAAKWMLDAGALSQTPRAD